jgi:hypothetical protein
VNNRENAARPRRIEIERGSFGYAPSMPRRLIRVFVVLAAGALAPPAVAQLYKWVDEKGKTNYGSAPPASARDVEKVDERVSTVPGQRPEARPGGGGAAKQAGPEAQQRAQSAAGTDAAAARERCIAERRVDCDDPVRGVQPEPGGYPYAVPPLPAPRPGAPKLGPRPTPR